MPNFFYLPCGESKTGTSVGSRTGSWLISISVVRTAKPYVPTTDAPLPILHLLSVAAPQTGLDRALMGSSCNEVLNILWKSLSA